tara:strand:- start:181365 stop:182864 length:1500 start_codon:yes stop_codon:yes gene_type:complete
MNFSLASIRARGRKKSHVSGAACSKAYMPCFILVVFQLVACGGSSTSSSGTSGRDVSSTLVTEGCNPVVSHSIDREMLEPASKAYGCVYPLEIQDHAATMQLLSDGTLFVGASSGGVYRSFDQGKSWEYIEIPPLENGDSNSGSHGIVHVDPRTDRLYYLTSTQVPSCATTNPQPTDFLSVLRGSVLSWSDDAGNTWEGATIACDTYDWGKVATGPAPQGNAYPSAIYVFGVAERLIGGKRYVDRSLDGGVTWERMANIASATTEAGSAVAGPDGTIYFEYPEYNGYDPARVLDQTYPYKPENACKMMVAISEDYGETWRQEAVPGTLACFLGTGTQKVAIDNAGAAYLIWVSDVDGQLYMNTSVDRGHTWTSAVNIMPPEATFSSSHVTIAAAESGHILIAGMLGKSATNGRVGVVHHTGQWYSFLMESFNASAEKPFFDSVNLDSDDDPSVIEGESMTEMNGYTALTPSGEGWAVFVRHSGGTFSEGNLVVSRIVRP